MCWLLCRRRSPAQRSDHARTDYDDSGASTGCQEVSMSAEIQPNAAELPQVIVGACGCVLPADALPAGFRFVATPTGDKRVAVYCCDEHNKAGRPHPALEQRTRPR